MSSTDLAHKIPKSGTNFTLQDSFAILCHPHKVVLDVVAAMSAGPIVLHAPILAANHKPKNLKVSPEGEGFRPIARTIKAWGRRPTPLRVSLEKSRNRKLCNHDGKQPD